MRLPYVGVADADATTAKAKELGRLGRLGRLEPMEFPKVGRLAVLRDPQGAVFGVIKPQM